MNPHGHRGVASVQSRTIVITAALLVVASTSVASTSLHEFPSASVIKPSSARECLHKKFDSEIPQDRKVYSQYGEDGILEAVFSCIGVTDRYYVEFGTQNGQECSTRNLREHHNFTGLMMDGGYANAAIDLHKEFIYAHNIAHLFQKYNVPVGSFDHATIDIDQNTFWVVQEVLRAGYRPRSLTIEFNRNFAWHDSYATVNMPDEMAFTQDSVACKFGCYSPPGEVFNCYFGASAKAYVTLTGAYGYHLVAVDREGVNIFFVHGSVIGSRPLFTLDDAKRLFSGGQEFSALHPQCLRMLWVKVEEGIHYNSSAWKPTDMPLVILSSIPGKKNPRQRVWYEVTVDDNLFSRTAGGQKADALAVASATAPAAATHSSQLVLQSGRELNQQKVVELWTLVPIIATSATVGALLQRFCGALARSSSKSSAPRYSKLPVMV